MTDFATIWTAIVSWARSAITAAGEDGANASIRVANQGKTRPDPPFMTIRLITWDVPTGATGYVKPAVGGQTVTNWRSATLSVQGFGEVTRIWLEAMAVLLDDEGIMIALEGAKLAAHELGGVTDVAALVDTASEPRFVREFRLDYVVTSTPKAVAALSSVVIDPITLERYEGASSPHTFELTISV